ncbi:hypothetical protein LBW59_23505 [Ralstonia solanacearum]|uniref:Uncharacterized protein n=1 Tax=Ralstonia solanacearum TaxID=305 RepID=A0AAE3NMM5_RALSL|nr:hypothetical protein [Ralstonia solanacearum]MBB6582845.1 hypothetical protein [Ralstonia solanacearum]MDB0510891.1 hypothetical protein [Ralstonia solanacearum]MDB0525010.1 hypothetical protein [Ralstonia solanacearum]MDB0573716.1 hypothetical protein [Ralstonia solanacearum]
MFTSMRFKTPVIDDVLSSNIDAMLEDKLLDLLGIHISRLMPPNFAASRKLDAVDCVARRTHFDPSLSFHSGRSSDRYRV